MLLELKKGVVYGPIKSRRLGPSLGLNILPGGAKVCTFNCLYCQYGWTDFRALGPAGGPVDAPGLPSADDVAKALEAALIALKAPPAFITFSGNGEPTVHPDFARIARRVAAVRDALAPSARTAILSNSTMISRVGVREALSLLDVRIMKLDAGTQGTLESYNQPAPGIDLESIVSGLRMLSDVTIQALFTGGPRGNASPADVEAWVKLVKTLAPAAVQIYTLARGYPSGDICALERRDLDAIARTLGEAGVASEVF
jgi:wyosine [tRNA(Phe)-imidazoG37] synthetase (radical SAM superfamily)